MSPSTISPLLHLQVQAHNATRLPFNVCVHFNFIELHNIVCSSSSLYITLSKYAPDDFLLKSPNAITCAEYQKTLSNSTDQLSYHKLKASNMPYVRKYTAAWLTALEPSPYFQKLIIDEEIEEFRFLNEISDIFSDFDDESTFDSDAESESIPGPIPPPTPLSPLALLVNAYNACPSSSTESDIINHLHNNPVTPLDVEILLPAFNRVFKVTNKPATSIGFFSCPWSYF